MKKAVGLRTEPELRVSCLELCERPREWATLRGAAVPAPSLPHVGKLEDKAYLTARIDSARDMVACHREEMLY